VPAKQTRNTWIQLLAVGLLVVAAAPAAVADLTLSTTVRTDMHAGENHIYVVVFLKGPWMRREMHAEGTLSEFFGETREIIHRQTGVRYRLYAEETSYSVDTVDGRLCGPEAIMDLRLLGRLQTGARGFARSLDSTTTHLDCAVQGVEVAVTTSRSDDTRITIWSCRDFDALFGADGRGDLFCDSAAVPARAFELFARQLATQFKLSTMQQDRFKSMIQGFPVVIESVSGPAGDPHTVTRISLEGVGRDPLHDSLFVVPPDYSLIQ